MKNSRSNFQNIALKAQVSTLLLFASSNLLAAAPRLPTIGPKNDIDANTDPADIMVEIFQWAGGIVVWLAVAWFGLQMFGQVLKAANDARGGESSWMEAGKSMVGNVLMFVFFLAIAVWYTAAFLS